MFCVPDCPAKFDVTADINEDGTITNVVVSGCIGHHGHQIEQRYMRISKVTNEVVEALLTSGVPAQTIKKNYFSISKGQGDQREKPLLYADVKRMEHNIIPVPSTYKWPKPDALMHVVKKEEIRLFNFASIMEEQELFLDHCARTKLCNTPEDRLLLVRISEFQRKMFRENPSQIFVDGKSNLT